MRISYYNLHQFVQITLECSGCKALFDEMEKQVLRTNKAVQECHREIALLTQALESHFKRTMRESLEMSTQTGGGEKSDHAEDIGDKAGVVMVDENQQYSASVSLEDPAEPSEGLIEGVKAMAYSGAGVDEIPGARVAHRWVSNGPVTDPEPEDEGTANAVEKRFQEVIVPSIPELVDGMTEMAIDSGDEDSQTQVSESSQRRTILAALHVMLTCPI